jgi:glycosyltransferase involved in cell wall biosynthesis
MKVAIYHNILWAKYKGVVFSQLYVRSSARGIATSFIQIAETEEARVALGGVDLSYHKYPFRLLFRGAYQDSSRTQRIVALSRDILNNPSDLVVIPGHYRVEHWAMLFLCILLRRKRAVFCDSTRFDRPHMMWKEFAKRRFFRRCDGIFCYGIRSKEYLMGYGVSESKIIFRCQVAALPHDYDPAKVLLRYQTRESPAIDPPRFLYVGRLSKEKGIDDLLNAFRMVLTTLPNAKLEIVGAGPAKQRLEAQARKMDLQQSVNFLGPKNLDAIAALFESSTALVLPSHSEPWGLVVNEALSYGCPVVVSNSCGCVPDLVLSNVTGFSFDAGDIGGMADAMLSCARMAVDRVEVARRCLELISRFTPERAATQILDGCVRIAGKGE